MKRLPIFVALGLSATTCSVWSADWERTASITPSVTWTDNICLERERRSDTIFAITPSVSVTGTGARAFVRLNGGVTVSDVREKTENCERLGGGLRGQADTVVPRLALDTGSELLRDFFFVEASARVTQNLINAGFVGNDDPLNRAGNTNTSQTYRISPYVQTRLAGLADLDLRYAYDEQINSTDFLPNSQSHTVQGSLAQDPELSKLSFGVRGSYNEVEFDGFPGGGPQFDTFTSELGSAEIFTNFHATRTWTLTAAAGREWNDFLAFGDDDIDGSRWDVGAVWEPNERITVNGGYGERFFGAAPRLDVRYRHLRSELRLAWSRGVNFNRDFRRGRAGFDDDNLSPEFDPISGVPLGPVASPTTGAFGPIINESVRLAYSLRGLRTTLSLDGSFSEQQRIEDAVGNTFFNASAGLSRRLSSNSTLDLRVGWLKTKGDQEGVATLFGFDSEEWRYSFSWNRSLSQRTRFSLLYQYTDRQSDVAFLDYIENRVVLTLTLDL